MQDSEIAKVWEILQEAQLPDDYINLFINQIDEKYDPNYLPKAIKDRDVSMLLESGFDWAESNEGYDFWDKVWFFVDARNPLPKIPDVIFKQGELFENTIVERVSDSILKANGEEWNIEAFRNIFKILETIRDKSEVIVNGVIFFKTDEGVDVNRYFIPWEKWEAISKKVQSL